MILLCAGAIVPVAPGRMRNIWYPGRRAEYVTTAQLREMGDVVIERDFAFGMDEELAAQETVQQEKIFVETKPLHVGLISSVSWILRLTAVQSEQATSLLESFLPRYLDFYRSPIITPEPEPPRSAPTKRTAASQAAADLAAAYAPEPKPKPASIYGSVSTADIATSIKTILTARVADNPEIGRIVLNSEDIRLVQHEGENDDHERIKTLGEFNIEITIEGRQPVKRIVRVVAQQ